MMSILSTVPSGPPQNFAMTVDGVSLVVSWDPPLAEDRNGIIISFTLSCNLFEQLVLNPISEISLHELDPDTEYSCRIAASTAVGLGPYTVVLSTTTEGIHNHKCMHIAL